MLVSGHYVTYVYKLGVGWKETGKSVELEDKGE